MDNVNSVALVSVLEQVQHHHFTHALQGLLPPTVNAHKMKHVLDVHSHIGTWAIDLALAYPHVTIIGLESDPRAVELARNSTLAGNIDRVHFYEANLHSPLQLADNTFDFVHLFLSQPLFRAAEWPSFLEECYRVLRPGGVVNLVNVTLGPGSSHSYQRFSALIDQMLCMMGYGFAEHTGTSAPGVYFATLLRQAGFVEDGYLLRPVNLGGWNNPGGRACCQLFLRGLKDSKDALVGHNLVSDAEFDALIAQKEIDILEADFCATAVLISAFATKK